ncbi:hypothetical protein LZK98_17690 [Sphingomonas cannabina]|uniref:JAB domain-containing protein n=1 Tax=Sphingomonas cannabina TaxID=2899123 RepID=UPI001F15BBBB|nr:JAB domain-containing protein [Sphingomonas cannabina]UIJ44861.1 hypothetical protein LZK98_17690 [Sphingomonas cannabina]
MALSAACGAGDRNLAASQEADPQGHRQILVDLFGTIDRLKAGCWADILIRRYSVISNIFAADPVGVSDILGDSRPAFLLSTTRGAMLASLRERAVDALRINCLEDLKVYLRADMAALPCEVVRLILLDNSRRLLLDETVGLGTIDEVSVHPREIVRRALERNSRGAILVHNHPSGLAKPSRADRELTKSICTALQLVGVTLIDHLIIAKSEIFSMREAEMI